MWLTGVASSFVSYVVLDPGATTLVKKQTLSDKEYRAYYEKYGNTANLPPSSCIIGLSSGGITGRASIIIHSGLLPDWTNELITSKSLN